MVDLRPVAMPKSSSNRKRQKRQASMWPMMMPGFHNMMQEESSSSEEAPAPTPAPIASAASSVVDESKKEEISRAHSYMRNLPRQTLSKLVAGLEDKLDASWTSDLSNTGLLCLIYIYCRVKPPTPISQLLPGGGALK